MEGGGGVSYFVLLLPVVAMLGVNDYLTLFLDNGEAGLAYYPTLFLH